MVSGFSLANEENTWRGSSRYKRHYQICDSNGKEKNGKNTFTSVDINLEQPLASKKLSFNNNNFKQQKLSFKQESYKPPKPTSEATGKLARALSNGPNKEANSNEFNQMPKLKSFLFENQYIYLDRHVKNGAEYMIKILENSGNIVKSLSNCQNQRIWIVLPDNYAKSK